MAKMDFDTYFDNLETNLKAYSAAQIVGLRFDVTKDTLKIKQAARGVFIYMNFVSLLPTEEAQNVWQHKATFNLDCVAINKSTSSETADEASNERLRFLISQVLEVVFDPENRDNSLPVGSVTKISIDSVTAFPKNVVVELGNQGMRIVVTAEFGYDDEATGNDLEMITITAPNWAAIFENE